MGVVGVIVVVVGAEMVDTGIELVYDAVCVVGVGFGTGGWGARVVTGILAGVNFGCIGEVAAGVGSDRVGVVGVVNLFPAATVIEGAGASV